jgi:hypothetical protein
MPLKVWNGSAWQVQAQIKVWNGSSWVPASAGKVWNGSSWVQFHPGVYLDPATLLAYDVVNSPNTAYAQCSITLNSNGTATYTDSPGGTTSFSWLLSGSNSDYYAYMDAPSGDPFTSGTTGTALQLNTTRSWFLDADNSVNNSIITKTLSSTLRIRNSAGTDIVAVAINLTSEAQVGVPP